MGNIAVQENLGLNIALERSKRIHDPDYAAEVNAGSGMQSLDFNQNRHLSKEDKSGHVNGVSKTGPAENTSSNSGPDPVMMALLYMMEYVNMQQQTASIQAKQLQDNAEAQINLNNQDAENNFIPLTTKQLYKYVDVKTGTWGNPFKGSPIYYQKDVQVKTPIPNAVGINQVQNQQVEVVRNNVANQMTILRQVNSVGSTQVSTTVNQSQQTVSAFAAVVNVVSQVSQQIEQR